MKANEASKKTVELNQDTNSWYVYMIRAHDNSLYTGITTDVERRFAEHKGETGGAFKGAKALRNKRRLKLVLVHAIDGRSRASKLESQIKRLSKSKKEALVRGQMDLLSLISETE